MGFELNGQSAIVTGASRGIGRAIALRLGAMLVGKAAGWISGQNICANGGFVA